MKQGLHQQIDELYKLPLEEFTKARNALAKSLAGNDRKHVTSLPKPSLAMWVVNQLYWRDAPTYKALVDASEKLRHAHRAALNGRKVGTNKADELHRTTLEKAFAKASAIAQNRGVSLTDTVRDAVRRTLAALPTDEAAGRLIRQPPPAGFSLLTGIKPQPIAAKPKSDNARPTIAPALPRPSREALRQQQLEARRLKAAAAEARRQDEKARKEREKRERAIKKAEQTIRDAERRLAELKG